MRKTLVYFLAGAAMAAMLILASCSDDDDPPTGPGGKTTNLRVTSVTPADQTVGVSVNSPVAMKFNVAVDTASFNENFFVAGGPSMQLWVDSLSSGLSAGSVDYDRMLFWLDSVSTRGTFTWNTTGDSVTWVADSAFVFDSDYLIYLHNGVRGRRGETMKTDSLVYGSYTVFFHTAPAVISGRP